MPPKKVVNPKGKYIIYSRHKELPEACSVAYYVSIDPGENNLAISIRKRTIKHSKTLYLKKVIIDNLRERYEEGTISHRLENIASLFESLADYIKKVNFVLIEDQMYTNAPMSAMFSDIANYFYYNYPDICIICVSSKLKSRLIKLEEKVPRSKFRKLEIEKAMELSRIRNDEYAVKTLEKHAKSKEKGDKVHDLCITINQEEAFCKLVGYF